MKGYKELVSKKNDALYVELKSKIPLLEIVDNLCTSKVKRKRIYGNVIFTLYLFVIFGLACIITDNQLIQSILFPTTPIITIQMPLLFILLRQDGMSKVEIWCFFIPRGSMIILEHAWYICQILFRFLWKNRKNKGNTFIYVFGVFSSSYALSEIYVNIIYWLLKNLQFQNMIHFLLILIPLAFLSVFINHYLVYKKFLSTLGFAVLNRKLTYLFFFAVSFITFFSLLRLNIDYSYYKELKIQAVVIGYSLVLIFMELVFSGDNCIFSAFYKNY